MAPRRVWAKKAPAWRSGSESKVGAFLESQGVPFGFETRKVSYVTPARKHVYTPDFNLNNGVTIEVKGRWMSEDRQKIILVRKQNPDLDIRILFDNPKTPINKGSKTTYADFCSKNGIPYAKGPTVPQSWFTEDPPKAAEETP